MAVAKALLGFNDLGCSVNPTIHFRIDLSYSPNMNKKSMWDFCQRDIESCRHAAGGHMKLWSLNANLFFVKPNQLTKFVS